MGCSRTTVGLMIAIAGCIGASHMVLAADDQDQAAAGYAAGYAAPAPNAPDAAPALIIAKPPADPPPAPEKTFRDRLTVLDNVGPKAQLQPGFTTSDTTSSYSTSAGQGMSTGNTTSSYTTTPDPKP